MSAPALRFDNEQSPWSEESLINLSESGFTNGVFNDPKKTGRGYKLINVLDMYIETTIDESRLSLVELSDAEFKKNKVEHGEIFFTRSSLVKEGIAFSNIYLGHSQDVTFDGHLIRMRPRKDVLNSVFANYLLRTTKVRKQLVERGKTATMTTIGQADIAAVMVRFPSLPEQTKIANFLTAVDEKIAQLTRKHELLTQYKKGVMQQIFSQELRFKDDDGREFAEWEVKRIGDLTDKITAGATPSTLNKKYWGGAVRWMNSGELNLKRVFEVENRITDLGLSSSSTKLIPPKCVLIGLAGQGKTRGTVAMNMVELCTNQSIAAIHPNPKIFNEEFLFQNLEMRYDELRSLSTGDGGRGGLNLKIIKSIEIVLPCLAEQTKIANFLTAIDDKITATQTQLAAVKQYKQGLLQQMFV